MEWDTSIADQLDGFVGSLFIHGDGSSRIASPLSVCVVGKCRQNVFLVSSHPGAVDNIRNASSEGGQSSLCVQHLADDGLSLSQQFVDLIRTSASGLGEVRSAASTPADNRGNRLDYPPRWDSVYKILAD